MFKILYKFKAFIILITISSFFLGFLATDFIYNKLFTNYEVNIKINDEYYLQKDFYDSLQNYYDIVTDYNKLNKDDKITNLSISSVASINDVYNNLSYEKIDDYYRLKIKKSLFNDTFVSSTKKLSEGISKCKKSLDAIYDVNRSEEVINNNLLKIKNYYEGIKDTNPSSYNIYIAKIGGIKGDLFVKGVQKTSDYMLVNYQNPYIIGLITMAFGLSITLLIIYILYKKDKLVEIKDISNNETIFKTPFHKKYWKSASMPFKKVSSIALMAVLFSMMLVAKLLKLPSGFGELGLSFTFIFFSIIGMLFGPIAGTVIGFFSDIIGFFLFPSGYGFFFPYTIDAMFTGFIYGIFFYKTKLTFSRCFYARFIICFVTNVFFGSIWWSIINGFTFDAYLSYMMMISLPKNAIYLLPQAIILFIIFKPVSKISFNFGLIDEEISNNVSII